MEPNVDPGLVSAVNQLGAYMAAELTSQGKKGVVINAIYDGFHPGRAYMHYHGGARILSETASAQLASTVNVPREVVVGGREYEASEAGWNFPWPWEGGAWGLPDIVEYQFSGAMALLTNAAKNRRFWLENFHGVNRRAVEGWDEWPAAWVLPAGQENRVGLESIIRILTMGDVEVRTAAAAFTAGGVSYPAGSHVVLMRQPNASFAQTLLSEQEYPDLREFPGGPPKRPYDVTAHTLPLLMGAEAHALEAAPDVALSEPMEVASVEYALPDGLAGAGAPRVGMYKGHQEPMIAGWTRWMLDKHGMRYDSLHDARIRAGSLDDDYDVLIFQSQSDRSISEGHQPGSLPEQFTGGLGEEGRAAVREFVESGGRLVVMEEAADFAASVFGLGGDQCGRRAVQHRLLRARIDSAGRFAAGSPRHRLRRRNARVVLAEQPRLRRRRRAGRCDRALLRGRPGGRWLGARARAACREAGAAACAGRERRGDPLWVPAQLPGPEHRDLAALLQRHRGREADWMSGQADRMTRRQIR